MDPNNGEHNHFHWPVKQSGGGAAQSWSEFKADLASLNYGSSPSKG